MSKIAINNEIVLMRQAVRKTRVIVVRKLIKEAKLLQARKHGDEKTQEKCKRKAQRLVAEIEAVKKIKDDEISKFGITNTRQLQDVLSDTTCEPATRIMTRLIFHKILADRIEKFKEKFPDYEQHLGPGRKKLSKLQRQANREARNAMKRNPGINSELVTASVETSNLKKDFDNNVNESLEKSSDEEEENIENSDETESESDDKVDENKMEEIEEIEDETKAEAAEDKIDETNDDKDAETEESLASKHNLEPGSILRIKTPNSTAKKRKNKDAIISQEDSSVSEILKKPKNEVETKKSKIKTKVASEATKGFSLPNISSEPKKPKPIKVISKEATVKRFTDLIEEKETEEIVQEINTNTNSRKNDMKIEKEVDSFFMTENGDREYLSVVVPKSKLCDNDEQDERFSQNHAAMRQKNFHERNNKFFSKIDQRSNSYGDKYSSNAGRQRSNNFTNGRGQSEKFNRAPTGPIRNSRSQIEKKIETTDEHLHPSWAAKKKQQEILKQGFQGKKIVFDD